MFKLYDQEMSNILFQSLIKYSQFSNTKKKNDWNHTYHTYSHWQLVTHLVFAFRLFTLQF